MTSSARIKPIDSLRGLAALGVAVFYHYAAFPDIHRLPLQSTAHWFYHYGWTLVDFFFVLSGFVFSYVYKMKIANKQITLRNYAFLRFSRLYPLHFFTLIAASIFLIIRISNPHTFTAPKNADAYHFFLNIFFMQAGWFENGASFNYPAWSLGVEAIAYLTFFYIVWKFGTSNKLRFLYLVPIFLGLFIFKAQLHLPLLNMSFARVFIGFFIGALTFEVNEYLRTSTKKVMIISIFTILLISLITMGALFGNQFFDSTFKDTQYLVYSYWTVIYTVVIFPLIVLVSLNLKPLRAILSTRPLTFLGDISYSIYLCHVPIIMAIVCLDFLCKWKINFSSKETFLIYAVIVLVVATIAHYTIEKPCQKFLRNWQKSRRSDLD